MASSYDDLSKMPFSERVKRYQALALEARARAERVRDPYARRSFLLSATAWELLANSTDPEA